MQRLLWGAFTGLLKGFFENAENCRLYLTGKQLLI